MTKKFLYIFAISAVFSACGTLKKTKETPVSPKSSLPYIEKFHEAVRLKQRGQFKEAILAFENCQTMNPNDDAVYFALSELYLQTQQMTKSMEAIQKAAKIDPNNKWYMEELAYMQFEKKNYAEAAKQFQKLAEKEPRNVDILFSYAESLMRSKDAQGAIKVLDKLEDQVGLNPQLSIEKFRLYRQIKQEDKAVAEITKALKVFPSDAQLLANLVDYYFEKNQQSNAYDYLIKLAEADPSNGNAQMALAQYYDQKGERKASYDALKKAFASDDIDVDKKMKILLTLYDAQSKLDPELMEMSEILVNKYPEEAKVYAIQGDIYLKNEQPKEALIAFQRALEYDQSKYAIWDQVLIMEYQNQDFDKLYFDSKKCLELFPTLVNVYLLHGVGAIQTKRFSEAIDALTIGQELIVNDVPMQAEFLAQKGTAYFGLKKYAEGKESFDVSLKMIPDQALTLNNYAYQLALAKIDLDKATTMVEKVLSKFPKEPSYLDTYGLILFQQSKFAEAKIKFEEAMTIKPNDAVINEHLGDALIQLGKSTQAIEHWNKAKTLGSKNKNLDKKIEQKQYYEPIY